MPIIFQDLDSILFDWKQKLKMKVPEERTGLFVYNVYRKNIDNIFVNKITELFKSVDIKKVDIKKVEQKETENNNGINYIFNKNSKL